MDRLNVSERWACNVLRLPRATQPYVPEVRDDEEPLTQRIIELACVYERYGTLRITAMLRRENWSVNHKRVECIWRQQGLKVLKKQPKRGRLWLNDGSCIRLRPQYADYVWAYGCVSARTLRSDDVLERLSWLFATRGVHVRSENGPEFTTGVVREWLRRVGV